MNRDNNYVHYSRNIDIREVCENLNSLETHDNIPIRKILVANIDPTTSHKVLVHTFKKFGKIIHCILKKQRECNKVEINHNEEQDVTKSYAFITYSTAEEAQRAVRAGFKREISIKKQYLRVIPANSWNQPDNPDSQNKICYICKHLASAKDLNKKLPTFARYRVEDEAPISQLNNDCLRYIFNFLPFYDRVRVERVSRRWKAISLEAWHDQHRLDCNPIVWGLKSISHIHLTPPDSCSVYKIFKKCCPYLTHIDLSRFSIRLGNSILIELADMCPMMESINLKNFLFLRSGIKALVANCRNLKSITLGYTDTKYKFDNELSALFSSNKNLLQVEIDCFIIEGNCLKHIPKKSIEEITLRNCNYVFRNGLHHIFENFSNLRVIKIVGIPAAFEQYHDFIKCICSCSKLEVVEIPTKRRVEHNNINLKILKPLATLGNLTKINLKGNCTLNDDFLILLTKKCQKLKSVDIGDCPHVRQPGVESVTSLPNLEYLCIDSLTNITDSIFLKTMPKLKTLLCSGCINVHAFGLCMLLESANRLEVLDVSKCRFITNDFVIRTIRKCKRTKWRCLKLYLKGTRARIDGINLKFHWNYLRLINLLRPKEEDDLYHY